jgi:hypothetical protein
MRTCRVCHCSQDQPCDPPCSWEPYANSLCTNCAFAIRRLQDWSAGAHTPNFGRLITAALDPLAEKLKAKGVAR